MFNKYFMVIALYNFTSGVKIELPSPMKSNTPGTWAFDTMSRRISADIFPRLISDNADRLNNPIGSSTADMFMQLNDLRSSLDAGTTGYLRDIIDNGPDTETWRNILATQNDEERNWLDADWIVSEFYFYRRVAEAFRYFENGYDFFAKQKIDGLMEALPQIENVASRIPNLVLQDVGTVAKIAVLTSLWGNKMDLSLWPASKTENNAAGRITSGDALLAGNSYILDDHSEEVVTLLTKLKNTQGGKREVSVIVDNAGYELFSDLLLGHLLIESGCCDIVKYHTKGHPTFVSDALTNDILGTVDVLSDITDNEGNPCVATNTLARALQEHISAGRFVLQDDLFWCQPTAFWDMPSAVTDKIASSAIVFVKGDANYRRLLGEREWQLDTAAKDILQYWPVPVCALRTFKAEIGCGITAALQLSAAEQDAKWKVSGKWGVIQLGGKGSV